MRYSITSCILGDREACETCADETRRWIFNGFNLQRKWIPALLESESLRAGMMGTCLPLTDVFHRLHSRAFVRSLSWRSVNLTWVALFPYVLQYTFKSTIIVAWCDINLEFFLFETLKQPVKKKKDCFQSHRFITSCTNDVGGIAGCLERRKKTMTGSQRAGKLK